MRTVAASPTGNRPIRLATIPVIVCVLLYCLYRISNYIPWTEIDYDPGLNRGEVALVIGAILALGAVQIRYAVRRPSRLSASLLLVIQVALTYGPHLLLGGRWLPPAAFVVASVLLTFAGWWSWILAASAVFCDVLVRIALLPAGVDFTDRGMITGLAYAAIVATANGLLLFGMTRLSELVRDLHRTRTALASVEVSRERMRIAGNLQDAVGLRLVSIIKACRRAADEPGNAEETGRVVAAEARQAAAQVRAVTDDYRDHSLASEMQAARTVLGAAGVEVVASAVPEELPAPIDAVLAMVLRRTVIAALSGDPPRHCRIEMNGSAHLRVSFDGRAPGTVALDGIAEEVTKLGGRIEADPRGGVDAEIPYRPLRTSARRPIAAAPWLAWGIMAVIEVDMFVTALARGSGAWDFIKPLPVPRMVWMLALIVPLSLLQLHHVRPRSGSVPPGWRWTLTLQIVLLCVLIVIGGSAFPGHVYGATVAGVVLFHLRRPWSWVLAGGLLLSTSVVDTLNMGLPLAAGFLFPSPWTVYAMIAIATLCRLPIAAEQVTNAREEMARLAVLRERLRIARDTHDLLGFQLSTIAVKAGLAERLSTTDPSTASIHLAEAGQVAEQSLNSLRSIATEPTGLSFAQEIEGARSMLSAAGITVAVELHATPGPSIESPLAIVLREAVTNVVRHSRATTCRIETSPVPGGIRLKVINDGVRAFSGADAPPSGHGLANLRTRARDAGGRLRTQLRDDNFTLVAEI